jgi:HPt (histidine-containing phosphotransfer) domain-containing protein
MRFLGGRVDIYRRVLRHFVQLHGSDMLCPTLPPLPRESGAARAIAHSIRGAASTLGALRLNALAEALEVALATDRPSIEIDAAWRAMQAEIATLVAGISAELAGTD